MCLHNQYKHLENVTVMIYTKYVVLLTQLCMDGLNILHRGRSIRSTPALPALLVTSYSYSNA